MQQQKPQRIKDIDKQIIKVSLIEMPGTLLFALGLYTKFSGSAEPVLPFLQDPKVVNAIIVIGAAIMLWGTYKLLMLKLEKSRLQKGPGV